MNPFAWLAFLNKRTVALRHIQNCCISFGLDLAHIGINITPTSGDEFLNLIDAHLLNLRERIHGLVLDASDLKEFKELVKLETRMERLEKWLMQLS